MCRKFKMGNIKGYCQAIIQIIITNSVSIILGTLTVFSAILSILSIALVNDCVDKVVTKDNYLIVSKQNKRSLVNSDLYNVTSSGSADYKDIRGCKYFSDILIN